MQVTPASCCAAALGRAPDTWTLAYQSRFGREPWLTPDVTEVAPPLAAGGQGVLVAAPSFTTDCLETLEELGQRLREECEEQGGVLVLAPCLNERPDWIAAAAGLVRRAALARRFHSLAERENPAPLAREARSMEPGPAAWDRTWPSSVPPGRSRAGRGSARSRRRTRAFCARTSGANRSGIAGGRRS
jgi:Ferrochelatase